MRVHADGGSCSAQSIFLQLFCTVIIVWCVLQVAGQQGAYVARMINRRYTMGESHCHISGAAGQACLLHIERAGRLPNLLLAKYQSLFLCYCSPCSCC
jgi:hypothetical protein